VVGRGELTSMKALRLRLLFGFFALLTLASCGQDCGVSNDSIYRQCFYYNTDDMTPITVKFQREQEAEPVVSFTMPRAYIISALHYSADETPVLPLEIMPESLGLYIGQKTGLPHLLTKNENRLSIRLNANRTGSNLLYTIDRHINHQFYSVEKIENKGSYNLYHLKRSNHYDSFLDPLDKSARRSIFCSFNPKLFSAFSCRHYLTVRDGLEMQIHIPDFRANEGGLKAAEQNIAFVLRTLCPYLECDPKYTRYFYDQEIN